VKGILFDDFEVGLDDRMADPIGGAWQGPIVDGKLTAWDPDVLRFFWEQMKAMPDPVVVDVGASTGTFCLLAKFMPVRMMAAFEPYPVAFELLKSNVHLNGLDAVVSLAPWAIVGDDIPRAMLKVPNRKAAGFATIGRPKRFRNWEEVYYPRTERLDDLVFPKVDLIKIDTEGGELKI
jgi:FkbM family methyltransferase